MKDILIILYNDKSSNQHINKQIIEILHRIDQMYSCKFMRQHHKRWEKCPIWLQHATGMLRLAKYLQQSWNFQNGNSGIAESNSMYHSLQYIKQISIHKPFIVLMSHFQSQAYRS